MDEEEKRRVDGSCYTRTEFIEFYGGQEEWDAAAISEWPEANAPPSAAAGAAGAAGHDEEVVEHQELPLGWERLYDEHGTAHYRHRDGRLQYEWPKPTRPTEALTRTEFELRYPLPPGWDTEQDSEGECYFICHTGDGMTCLICPYIVITSIYGNY